MHLVADIGNSNVTVGVFENELLTETLRFATDPNRTGDEYAALLLPLLSRFGSHVVEAVAIAGVVPNVADAWRRLCEKHFRVEPLIVTSQFPFGFAIQYDPPASVGVDRLVNLFAARALCASNPPCAIVVVDFGTATTMDVLTHDDRFIGGAIWPGIATGFDALRARTGLPRVSLNVAPNALHAISNSTAGCLLSGVLRGESARVDGLLTQTRAELGDDAVVFLTGGLASVIASFCRTTPLRHEPDLTLQGLHRALRVRQSITATQSA